MRRIVSKLFILLFILILGCSTSKETENKIKEITGISAVVGNEPFTHLAIIANQQDVYFINSSKEIQKILLDNQGEYFKVFYIGSRDSADIHILQAIEVNKQ